MNPEEFKSRIMMPPQPMQEEAQPMQEEPEHPNTPVLENMSMMQHDKMSETNTLLEHLLVKLDDNADKTVEEHQLVKTAEVVDELKNIKDILNKPEEKKPEIQKIKIVTDESELADNFFRMLRGHKGDKGEKGDSIKGDKGDFVKGDKGDKGEQGKSIKGDKGDTGDNGKDGKDGKNGKNGKDGKDGKDGQDAMLDIEKLTEEILPKIDFQKIKGIPSFSGGISRVNKFTDLTDAPSSYTGQGGKAVYVNPGETGLQFQVAVSSDEKVKLNASDPTAGYLDDKIVAGGYLSSYVPYTGATTNLDLNAKVLKNFFISKTADATAKMAFDVSAISTATTRTITVPDRSFSLDSDTFATVTGRGNSTTTQYVSAEYTDTVSAGAVTVNWNNGNVHYMVLGNGATTITLSNPIAGGRYIIYLKQPASGAAGTITFSPVPIFSGGVLPPLTTTNGAIDVITLAYSTALGKYVGNYSINLS